MIPIINLVLSAEREAEARRQAECQHRMDPKMNDFTPRPKSKKRGGLFGWLLREEPCECE